MIEVKPALKATSDRHRRMCIIVAGMHRSGSSALTRVINLLGADVAKQLLPAAADNSRGFWEPARVVDIHEQLLNALGSSFDDPLPLAENWMQTTAAQIALRQLGTEIENDFANSALFVIKDPRVSRLLPLWLTLLDDLLINLVVVIPVRNPIEIAASLKKRNEFPFAKSFLMYLRSSLEVEFSSRGRSRVFTRYDRLLDDWTPFANSLRTLVGDRMPGIRAETAIEINDFLSTDLRRNKCSREQLNNAVDISATVLEVFNRMVEAADANQEQGLREAFDCLRQRLADATQLFQGLMLTEKDRHDLAILQKEKEVKITAITNEISRFEREVASANHKTNVLEEKLASQYLKTTRLDGELSASQMQVIELNSTLARRADEIDRLNQELSASRGHIADVNSRLETERARVTELESELKTMRDRFVMSPAMETDQPAEDVRSHPVASDACKGQTLLKAAPIPAEEKLSLRRRRQKITSSHRRICELLKTLSDLRVIRISGLLDRDWYLERYPDVRKSSIDPLRHYLQYGAAEGRDPGPLFDTGWYLQQYPDVRAARVNALVHYLRHGAREGRDPNPLFDSDWYLKQHPDVRVSGINPLVHYLRHGADEGYDPSPLFDSNAYLKNNPDVCGSGTNPLIHYFRRSSPNSQSRNERAVSPTPAEPRSA
jgi:hypothetical protein